MRTIRIVVLAFLAIALPGIARATPFVYVTNQAYNSVNVYRTSDWLLTSVIALPPGAAPSGISIPSVGGFAYVANRGNATVSRIDLASGTVTATIPVPGGPTSVSVSADGARAYVVQSTNCPVPSPSPTPTPAGTPTPGGPTPSPTPIPCTVAAIDATSNTVVATITVGVEPFAVALSSNGGYAYVTNRADGTLSVIDTASNTVVDTIPVGERPEGVTVGAGEIYVTNDQANTVTVVREVDLAITDTIAVGAGPLAVAVSPDGTTAVVGNDLDGTASILGIGTHAVLSTVAVGTNPAGIAILPDSSAAVVANNTGSSLSVVPLTGGTGLTIPMVGAPTGVAISPEPRFRLTKTASVNPVIPGTTVTYSFTYSNLGSGPATNVTITDPIPANLTFVSATGGGVLAAPNVQWTIPTIPVGGGGTVEATFQVNSPLADNVLILNTATIADAIVPPHTATATAEVRVKSRPQFSLSLLAAPDPVDAGATLTYTLTYGNIGTNAAPNTKLDFAYDANVTFVSATPAPDAGFTNHWTLGNLAVGATGTVTITVNVKSPLANGTILLTQAAMSSGANIGSVATTNTVQSAAGLTLSATGTPDPASADSIILYDFTYGNTGNGIATGTTLTVTYDPNVTYVASNIPPTSGTTNTFSLGAVAGGATGHVLIQVRVAAVIPNGTVMSTSGQLTDTAGDFASAAVSTTAQSEPALALVKTDGPDPVAPGATITYTLTYSNTGSDVAPGVVLTETYSPDTSFVSAIPAPDAGTDNVWTIGDVAPGASGSVLVTVTANGANGSIALNAANLTDTASHSASAQATTAVALVPALSVTMTDGPDPIAPGGLLTYTITYQNTGTSAATGVTVVGTLPANTTFVSAVPAPDAGTTDRWTIGSLAQGASGTITLRAAVASGLANGSVLAAQTTIDDDAMHAASANASTTVQNAAGLVIASTQSPGAVGPGQTLTYTISYGNQGTSPLSGVVVTETYDPSLIFVSATPAPDFATNNSWTLGTLAPGSAGAITITLQVPAGALVGSPLVSEATITAPAAGTARAAQVGVVGVTALQLTLTATPNPTDAAARLDYSLVIRNTTLSAVAGIAVTFDPDPRTVLLDSVPAVVGPLAWTIPTLAAGASTTIQIGELVAAPPGAILSAHASAVAGPLSASATVNTAVGSTGALNVKTLKYIKRAPTGRPHDAFKLKAEFTMPGYFDPAQPVGITISTADRVLIAFYVPANAFRVLNLKRAVWLGVDPALNAKVKIGLTRGRGNTMKLFVSTRNATVVWPNSTSFRVGASVNGENSVGTLNMRKLSKSDASNQYLVYP